MSTTPDPWNDPDVKAWAAGAAEDLVPKLMDSAIVLSMVPPGPTDIKFALELGLVIMLDKPIIALVLPGAEVPPKLAKVVDHIIVADIATTAGSEKLMAEIQAFIAAQCGPGATG